MPSLSRRSFLRRTTLASSSLLFASTRGAAANPSNSWRAAIIGCTGRGDYGHELDLAFRGQPQVRVVAVADPDPAGRARAAGRAQAERQYSDYREMLVREKPDLVVIAPRWSEDHHAMALAALEQGAHLLTEKPLTATLSEAGEILALAKRDRRQVAVAHQMRLAPNVAHLRSAVANGLIGELVSMRCWGKQDRRAGGEDMLVLGTHLFDMMRSFAGDALSCAAQVFFNGRKIARADGRPATEKIGLVAGDEIEAQFEFGAGVTGSFTSRGRLRETLGPWALELLGSRGAVRILMDIDPIVLGRERQNTASPEITDRWRLLPGDPTREFRDDPGGFGPANDRVVADWLQAIAADREPQCSGHNAMKALEMVMAVYEATLSGSRVQLPLTNRSHPLQRGALGEGACAPGAVLDLTRTPARLTSVWRPGSL